MGVLAGGDNPPARPPGHLSSGLVIGLSSDLAAAARPSGNSSRFASLPCSRLAVRVCGVHPLSPAAPSNS